MKRLSKVVKQKRKNYKPTIGLRTSWGGYESVNAVPYYIKRDKILEAQAKREAKKFLMGFLEKEMPEFFGMLKYFGSNFGAWGYY